MRGAVRYSPGDVRVEERADPTIVEPTDAVIRLAATCVCGSDLWPYRGLEPVNGPAPMGHEYVGVVEEVGDDVRTITPGQFVVGSFFASDNTCEICRAGYQTSCIHRQPGAPTGAQAQYARIALADGTLVATPDLPADDLEPARCLRRAGHRLVRRRGRRGRSGQDRRRGRRRRGRPARGDGRPAARRRADPRDEPPRTAPGARPRVRRHRYRHRTRRRRLRPDQGPHRRAGAHSVIEAVGTQESMMQAIRSTRPGGHVGYVGVSHDVALPGQDLFFSHVHLHGGPAPVRRFLPDLVERITSGTIDPGKVFDLELPLEQAAEGYRAMDERRAIKTLLQP